MLLSEVELVVSDESEELEPVLELGELFTDSLDSVVLFLLLHDLFASDDEPAIGADEFDIEPLPPAGAAAAPEPFEDGLAVL